MHIFKPNLHLIGKIKINININFFAEFIHLCLIFLTFCLVFNVTYFAQNEYTSKGFEDFEDYLW